MSQLAIRCHPCAPIATEELEQWLEQEVEQLRASAPHAVLRLLRLSQQVPTAEADIGWMIELDTANGEAALDENRLAAALRDMRLLGLQPTLLRGSESDDAAVAGTGMQANGAQANGAST